VIKFVDSISLRDILVGDEDQGNIYFLRSGSSLLAYICNKGGI
jgi:hypothetical protein